MSEREPASEIEDTATSWAVRAERGLTDLENLEFEAWIEDDSRRLGAFVRAQAAWIHSERAASLGGMPQPQAEPIPQEAVDDLQGTPDARRPTRRLILGGSGAIAASCAAAYIMGVGRSQTLESGVGEIRHIALRGGTRLTLDTDTRVDVAYSSNDRKLDLIRGNVFLDVQHSAAPVLLKARGLVVEAMRGSFGLRDLAESPLLALVVEGSVLITQSSGLFGSQRRELALNRGQLLSVSTDGRIGPEDVRMLPVAEEARLLAWRDGMLSFGGQFLADAAREFDRYGAARIIIADPGLARQRVTGLFRADDPRGFATAVAASFGGVVVGHDDFIRILAK